VEANSTRAAELAKLYACRVFTDLDTALRELKGVRGVWVATPTPTHRAAIQQAAAAGKAIGVEKPVAESVEETVECYRTAAWAGVPLYCSFQRRTDPSYQRLLRVVRSGEVGRVMSVHAVFRDHPVPPIEFLKTGGSIYLDLVVHDADFIMHALRETPVKVGGWARFHVMPRRIWSGGLVMRRGPNHCRFMRGAAASTPSWSRSASRTTRW
jgi:predicted dehydrogenase